MSDHLDRKTRLPSYCCYSNYVLQFCRANRELEKKARETWKAHSYTLVHFVSQAYMLGALPFRNEQVIFKPVTGKFTLSCGGQLTRYTLSTCFGDELKWCDQNKLKFWIWIQIQIWIRDRIGWFVELKAQPSCKLTRYCIVSSINKLVCHSEQYCYCCCSSCEKTGNNINQAPSNGSDKLDFEWEREKETDFAKIEIYWLASSYTSIPFHFSTRENWNASTNEPITVCRNKAGQNSSL